MIAAHGGDFSADELDAEAGRTSAGQRGRRRRRRGPRLHRRLPPPGGGGDRARLRGRGVDRLAHRPVSRPRCDRRLGRQHEAGQGPRPPAPVQPGEPAPPPRPSRPARAASDASPWARPSRAPTERRCGSRDLEIPYEAVVAGVRRRSFERLPASLREQPERPEREVSAPDERRSALRLAPDRGPADVGGRRVLRPARGQGHRPGRRRAQRAARTPSTPPASRPPSRACCTTRRRRPTSAPRRCWTSCWSARTWPRWSTAAWPPTSRPTWPGPASVRGASARATPSSWRSTASTRSGIRATCGCSPSPRPSPCSARATPASPTGCCASARRSRRWTSCPSRRASTRPSAGAATAIEPLLAMLRRALEPVAWRP